ncbi:MAG: FAD-binding oxidoreductase [Crocinitomicaceae bacterium]
MIDKQAINASFYSKLEEVCSRCTMQIDESHLETYGKDISNDEQYAFSYLAKPINEVEVSGILRLCNEYNIPVTPHGGGSGLTGGANPVNGGLVLSMEKMDAIIEIDQVNKTAIVESGAITQIFCEAVEEKGLFFPVQPGSSSMSLVGGNVATNAGSMSSLKYGSIIDYVLNLQVVLANGEIIWTGANTSKSSTGPNVTKLMVGSEGTLGVITKIVFKLIPKPLFTVTLQVNFESDEGLCQAVNEIAISALQAVEMELVDGNSVSMTSEFLASKSSDFPISSKPELLLTFNGNNEENVDRQLEKCFEIVTKHSDNEVRVAKSHDEKMNVWKTRLNIGEALKHGGRTYRDIDCAVPVSKLQDYLQFVNEVSSEYKVPIFCFGHAGNGNLHTMMSLEGNEEMESKALAEIYRKGIELGGTISGEHGIGNLQKSFMKDQFGEAYLHLLRGIKQAFDPNGIMNPGKIY